MTIATMPYVMQPSAPSMPATTRVTAANPTLRHPMNSQNSAMGVQRGGTDCLPARAESERVVSSMAAPHASQVPGVNPLHRVECRNGIALAERRRELRDRLTFAVGDVYQRRAAIRIGMRANLRKAGHLPQKLIAARR
ncbi:hypothetical protein X942_4611 [Burkholderia pseudomallei MSHR5596]|nr:hypothetical protein X942_4611 [Burkholderia pseudomallei MSHR5596]